MIRVARGPEDAPPAWVAKAERETGEAIAAYKAARRAHLKSRGKKKVFAFKFAYKVYGDILLRNAINTIYRYKCAYCETFFGASQPVAVEHYRPKGEVIEGTKRTKPGYYWLAATWKNLLPSCTDCNSPRRQRVSLDGEETVRGKGNYFPLEPGSKRARVPGKERFERPLLLHPEFDQPDEHLEFLTAPDRVGLIRPTIQHGAPSPKGVASIVVYALDRLQLQQGRQMFAKRLLSHLRNTKKSESRHRAEPADAALREEYNQNLADLKEFLDPGQPYCAMSRQLARAELPGLAI